MKREKKFSMYLLEKYTKWMNAQKEVKTTADFADATGINRQTINKLLKKDSDNIPQLRTVHALANVIGDDIYDFLEITKAEIEFDMVKQSWDSLPADVRVKITELIKPYLKQ